MSTFSRQGLLPKLPVPALEDTVARYLTSIEGLVSKDELDQAKRDAQEFIAEGGLGHKLQERLLERANKMKDRSWLIDWWYSLAYLGYRDSVVINVSYSYGFEDDRRGGSFMDQCRRAALFASAAMDFRKLVQTETLSMDKLGRKGDDTLCMHMYKYNFNACRIPKPVEDITNTYDMAKNTHIVVIRHNYFWSVDTCHPDGSRLTVDELQACFEAIKKTVGADYGPPIGSFTGVDRDFWAAVHPALACAHPCNQGSLDAIEASAFVVCLDDTSPKGYTELVRAVTHGDGRNRWYDKSMQFIFFENGRAGFLGEHSISDGMPTVRVVSEVVSSVLKYNEASQAIDLGKLRDPQALHFNTTPVLDRQMELACQEFDEHVNAHEFHTLVFTDYGKELVKTFKVSPDAWAQLAMQLAYRKTFGTHRATYEPAHTRKFHMGRTEVIRTATPEAVTWATAMIDPSVPLARKADLLRGASKKHGSLARMSLTGEGIDRHLFGMKLLMKPGESAPFLTSKTASETSTWYLSTSNLSSPHVAIWGFGQVTPKGLGSAYSVRAESYRYSVCCRKDFGKSKEFVDNLRTALQDMRAVMEMSSGGPKAKL